jgi:DNA-binding SARP family transcriptional activator
MRPKHALWAFARAVRLLSFEVVQFRVLGPVDLVDGDRAIALPKPRSRAVLAYLLLSANHLVTTDSIVDAIWGEAPPSTARNQIQVDISALRRSMRQHGLRDPIQTSLSGYQIGLRQDELDLSLFHELRQAASSLSENDDLSAASSRLRKALDLWRGHPLGDVSGAFVDAARVALTEQHLTAFEDWAEFELRLGRHRAVVAELNPLALQHPLRERIVQQLAIALHREGRTAEALSALRRLRTTLAGELGVDMSPALAQLEVSMLRGEGHLVPASAARPTVNTLPPSVPAFTGRSAEIQQLDTLIATGAALVTVTGSGGIGKTALALHWAHRAARRFPDGSLYVDLCGFAHRRPVSALEALSRLLHQLGVPPAQIPVREEYAIDLYRSRLAGTRTLVVLDNARDSDHARQLLPGEPGCAVVVTSRIELSGLVARDGAVPIRLDVLSPAESRAVLTALLGPADPTELDELAHMCAHVPLALRIAAASLRGAPRRQIREYLARIRSADRLGALQLAGDDHTAMSTTLRLSYDVLDPLAAKVFRLLSVIPGPDVTADSTAALTGLSVDQAEQMLTLLASAHLADERASGRYGFHDLLRLFAAHQAEIEQSPAELADARHRLYQGYLGRVIAAARRLYPQVLRLPQDEGLAAVPPFENDSSAVAWLDAERLNLVAAVVSGCDRGPRRLAWQLADALRGYFFLKMFTVDWHTVANAALAAAQSESDAPAQAAAWLGLADLCWRQGDYDAAEDAYRRATRLATSGDWPAGQAVALGNLGGLRRMQGKLTEAAMMLEQSLALNVEIGRIEGQLVNLGNLGVIYGEIGDWARAEDYLVRTFEMSQQVGSGSAIAVALSNLVEPTMRLGHLDLAEARMRQALTMHRELGDKAAEASTLRSHAVLRQERGDLPTALSIARCAVTLAESTEDHRVLAHCLHLTAAILHELGDHDAALDPAERSVKLANGAGHRFVETRALLGLARIHRSLDRPRRALTFARQALALAKGCGYLELAEEAAHEVELCG